MRALQITGVGRPLVAVDLPEPEPGPGEVVVRVEAAGICRSDVHYRSGHRPVPSLPLVPGHEVAGMVVAVGDGVPDRRLGRRVCLHYLVTCGVCPACRRGAEPFCTTGQMIGLDRQGGYAEAITIPERNTHDIPEGVSSEAAAVMMCSTATSLHALRRGALAPGETVAVIGCGGLGMSAIQLARALGAGRVFAVDLDPAKLDLARRLGAIPIDARGDVVGAVLAEGGADVALELVGRADLVGTAVATLAPGGRAVAVGITAEEFGIDPFRDLIRSERALLGAADHLAAEIDEILAMAARGVIDLSEVITGRIPLEAGAVNDALDHLAGFGDGIRTVVIPGAG